MLRGVQACQPSRHAGFHAVPVEQANWRLKSSVKFISYLFSSYQFNKNQRFSYFLYKFAYARRAMHCFVLAPWIAHKAVVFALLIVCYEKYGTRFLWISLWTSWTAGAQSPCLCRFPDGSCQTGKSQAPGAFVAPGASAAHHVLGLHPRVKLGRCEVPRGNRCIAQTAAATVRLLGNGGGFVVANVRVERGDQHE